MCNNYLSSLLQFTVMCVKLLVYSFMLPSWIYSTSHLPLIFFVTFTCLYAKLLGNWVCGSRSNLKPCQNWQVVSSLKLGIEKWATYNSLKTTKSFLFYFTYRKEFEHHKIADLVTVTCQDVCKEGFGLSQVADAGCLKKAKNNRIIIR